MDAATFLIVVATAAFVLPLVARRVAVPAMVLEILFGMLVGPSLANVVAESELLNFLAELGFLLLMFLSGFEIDFRRLERQGPVQIGTGLVVFGLTLGIAFFAAGLLGLGMFTGFLLATTSVGVVVPTLRSTRRSDTPLGQATLIQAIMADFLTLVGVTAFAVFIEYGAGPQLLSVPVLLAIGIVVLLALRRAAWWFPGRFERLFNPEDPEELGIRASLALMLVFVGLALQLDLEPILGAFLAGAIIAKVFPHRGVLEQQLAGFSYGFLIPIFFINVGVRFDIDALLEPGVFGQGTGLIAAAVVVKLVPALVYVVRRLSLREALAAGTLLSARLSLIIAVAEVGLRLGLIDAGLEAAVILLAIVSTTVAPTVFRLLAPELPAPVGAPDEGV